MPLMALAALIILAAVAMLTLLLRSSGPPPYRRAALFSPHEAAFYRELRRYADARGLTLLAKVRMADLLAVEKGATNYQAWFNRISQKHADFVLCGASGLTALAVVELDDSTHDRPDRKRRDKFVDAAYTAAGIPIIHIRSERGKELAFLLDRTVRK